MSKSGWIRSLALVDPECSYHNQMYVHEMEKSITYTIIHNPSNYSYYGIYHCFRRNKDINPNMLKLVMKIRMLTM